MDKKKIEKEEKNSFYKENLKKKQKKQKKNKKKNEKNKAKK